MGIATRKLSSDRLRGGAQKLDSSCHFMQSGGRHRASSQRRRSQAGDGNGEGLHAAQQTCQAMAGFQTEQQVNTGSQIPRAVQEGTEVSTSHTLVYTDRRALQSVG